MSTTFIKYSNDNGFWISDIYMQLAYTYIYLELEKPLYNLKNKAELLFGMKFQINGYATDMISLGWNSRLANKSEIKVMTEILHQVKADLNAKGNYISIQELKSIQSEDYYFKQFFSESPFPVAELIKIIDALIQLLDGTWTSNNYDMNIDYE